jgi:NAD(P)-dependent dehydrogenase (short-subunit alcohol dehydrogenase family)
MSVVSTSYPVPTATPLDGMAVLVTGAGRGLGRGIAQAMAAAGAAVTLVSRSAGELERAAAEISAAGGSASTAVCDVTDGTAFGLLVERLDALDVLVNNAGINVPQPFVDVEAETLDRILSVNVRATFLAAQAAARRMIARGGGGAIVNVTSQMGHVGAANRSAYCTSKHAVEGLTKALAVELAPHAIRVNAIAPTYVETPLTAPFLADAAFREDVIARIPLGRVGAVAEVAAGVVFLASPAASLITGASLVIDGGYTAQ